MKGMPSRCIGALVAISLSAGAVQAQVAQPWDFGLTAGLNVATFGGDDAEDADNLIGFMAGVSLAYALADRVAFQPELLYSRKGAEFSEAGFSGDFKIDYLDVPLLLRIAMGTTTQLRPVLFIGPSVGFVVNCDASITGLGSGDCKDDVKSTDFGVIAGIGFDIRRIGVFARYQYGFTKVFEDDEDFFNRVITIGGRVSIWPRP